jgi:diguanylate cyclase (GGDEF)-like protein
MSTEAGDLKAVGRGPTKAVSETTRLRLLFLAPLSIVIISTIVVAVTIIVQREQHDVRTGVLSLRTSTGELYERSVRRDAQVLRTLMDVLSRDEMLRSALTRKDRVKLLARAAPIFEDMKRSYGVTHFYFTGPDRVNILRVHQPDRYGDVIDRVTTRLAEQNGASAYGVELGPLGTFTLRFVTPWYNKSTGSLLGYVELGMEIDSVLKDIGDFFHADVFILIRKQFLDRKKWEEGMHVLGRGTEWDRFPNVVLSTQTVREVPGTLARQIMIGKVENTVTAMDLLQGRLPSQPLFLPLQIEPLQDVAGRTVADLVLLVDRSQDFDSARQEAFFGILTSGVGGVLLFIFFYRLVGRIGRRIEENERTLQDLATRDGLTKLYNHSMFYSILNNEILRAKRFGHALSVLMLDIDHFKQINDAHGHVVGDRILERLARAIQQSARSLDSVCRYGGEEFCIILPETDAAAALRAAERLRTEVEQIDFDLGGGQTTNVTISVGGASLSEQASSSIKLTKKADAALYAAKEKGRNRVEFA